MITYVLAALASFGVVALKAFQQKNVIGDHKVSAAFTSYAIAFFDVAVITLVVTGGWAVWFALGTGGAAGVVLAMTLHDKLFKR